MPNDIDAGLHSDDQASAARPRAPTLVPLPEYGVIAANGSDAVAFLQAQLTADVAGLAPDRLQLAGYCTVKGRLLATFHLWRTDDGLFLRLPRELVATLIKRLSMFVLRSKVKLVDASDAWSTWALLGARSDDLRAAGLPVPEATWGAVTTGPLRVDRLPPAAGFGERFLLTLPAGGELPQPLASLPCAASEVWWASEIAAAVPTVFAATQEKFVPQMLNFEVLGGVNFRKGCYPGQEVVARSQYLGKLKRRMQIAHTEAQGVLPGVDVYDADGNAVGTVVMAAPAPQAPDGSDLLFELPVERLQSTLHLGSANGPTLAVRPLPYELFDPTA